jgi:predicted PurR-regulated permease PerM
MKTKVIEKNFFYSLLILVGILCILVFWPFLSTIVIGIALSVVLYPVYTFFNSRVTNDTPWLSSLLTLLAFIVVLGVPAFFIGSMVLSQSQELYTSITSNGGPSPYITKISNSIDKLIPMGMSFDMESRIATLVSTVSKNVATILTSTITTIFSFLLVLLSLFYFLKDGRHWRETLMELSPLSDEYDEKILSKFSRAVNGVMKGYLLIALVQGCLMGIGLWIFGVPNAALWGVFAGIASMVPSIGTALVALPAIAYLALIGDNTGVLGLSAWSLVIVGTIDNVLNPIVVGKKIDLHPLIILFSVLGGITVIGALGVLIGPLLVSLLYTLLTIYKEHFKD